MTDAARTGVGGGAQASTALLDDDDATLFPKLTEAQVRMLSPLGQVRPTEQPLPGRGSPQPAISSMGRRWTNSSVPRSKTVSSLL